MSSTRVDYALRVLESRSKGRPNELGFEDPAGIVRDELERLRSGLRYAVGTLREVEKLNIPARLGALEES